MNTSKFISAVLERHNDEQFLELSLYLLGRDNFREEVSESIVDMAEGLIVSYAVKELLEKNEPIDEDRISERTGELRYQYIMDGLVKKGLAVQDPATLEYSLTDLGNSVSEVIKGE